MARRTKRSESKSTTNGPATLEEVVSALESFEAIPECFHDRIRGVLARSTGVHEATQSEAKVSEVAKSSLVASEIQSEIDKEVAQPAIVPDERVTETLSGVVSDSDKKWMNIFESRFEAHPERHKGIEWIDVERSLIAHPEKWAALRKMEEAKGEPDVLRVEGGSIIFIDFCAESPKDRRNLNYREAAEKVAGFGANAKLSNEPRYRYLQTLGDFDVDLWCWIETTEKVLESGDALRGGRKTLEKVLESYDAHRDDLKSSEVCVNLFGALSRYDAGGFRCVLEVPKA
jgi:hypothetical protein